jgi:hypothetical protein
LSLIIEKMPRITLDKKGIIDMSSDEMRAILKMVTGYSFEYLQSLSKEQIEKLYQERANG